jgi:hypothetical protein
VNIVVGYFTRQQPHDYEFAMHRFSKRLHRSLSLAKSLPLARGVKRALLGAPKPDFDFWILSGDTKLLEEVEELLDLANLPPFLDRQRCRTFIHRFRQGVRTSADAHLFGCLAAVCFTAKHDG